MQFQNFPWDLLPFNENIIFCGPLKRPTNGPFNVLLYDAKSIGLDPEKQHLLGFALRVHTDGTARYRDIVMVGVDQSKEGIPKESESYNGWQYAIELPESHHRFVLVPYHIALRMKDNPLELHWRWSATEGTKLAVLGLERATKSEHVNEMWREINSIYTKLRPRSGGPAPTPIEDKLRYVNAWRDAKGAIPKHAIAARYGFHEDSLTRWEKELVRDGLISSK